MFPSPNRQKVEGTVHVKQLPELAEQLPVHLNQLVNESECPSICWRKL